MSVTTVGDVHVIDLGDGDNRLTDDVLDEFHRLLDELEHGVGARALVTRGSGKVWSNGLDLGFMTEHPSEMWRYLADVERLLARVIVLGVPTVAAITGHAFGAGAMLALCHDVSVMQSDRGYWRLPEVELGMDLSPGEHTLVAERPTPCSRTLTRPSPSTAARLSHESAAGTVTFLFSDIEGSTAAWERAPELMSGVLARHDRLLREAIVAHSGYVFATGGDGFAVAFASVAEALGMAVDAQRAVRSEPWPDELPILVRMAVNSGEVVERDGDYFGPAVNRTARMMSTANGGQVVVSERSAGLVEAPPAGAVLEERSKRERWPMRPVG